MERARHADGKSRAGAVSAGGCRDLFVSSTDGLRLYARDQGPLTSDAVPVVCLPGFARTSADFNSLAAHLANDPVRPRRVLSVDYRGRGRSEWDKDWRRYDIRVELEDVLQVLVAAGIEEAIFVGTSRGGLITMGLGALRPTLLRGVVLNDIGPVIEASGLARIRGYIGKLPSPRRYEHAVEILKSVLGSQFPELGDAGWDVLARGTWLESGNGLVLAYDPKLMNALASIDPAAPPPTLWPLFEALKHVPVLVLRGAHSDILSAATVEQMQAIHPSLEATTVPGQGHAPLLEGDVVERISHFIAATEAAGARGGQEGIR